MDSFAGHTTKSLSKTLLKNLIHVVNIYEQSVDETPNLSAKFSFNNPNLDGIRAKAHHADSVS